MALAGCSQPAVKNAPPAPPDEIHRIDLPSTAIPTAGYDESRQILELQFHNGAVYRYYQVPPHVYIEFCNADSPGRYFNRHIRRAGYAYRQTDL